MLITSGQQVMEENCRLLDLWVTTRCHEDIHKHPLSCLSLWQCNLQCTKSTPCLALYPGLLTPVFVACSTNVWEGLVKLSHVQWRTWTCGGVAQSWKSRKWAHYRLQTQTVQQLSVWHQTVLATFLGFRKPLYSLYRSNVPHLHTSRYITARDSGLPRVSTASNKRWGEKDWVQGYATSVLVLAALFSKKSAPCGCSYWWLHTGWTTIHEAIFSANLTAVS